MPLAFAVVCEARADQETACGLAERVFCAEMDWISEEVLSDYLQWREARAGEPFLLWKEVPKLAKQAKLRAHGHFGGEPGAPDASAARRALLLLKDNSEPLDGVLLIRDDDRQTVRRRGLEQARKEAKAGVPIVIGLAHPKRECWVLAGFEPQTLSEQERLHQISQELGFDPCLQADSLTAKHDQDVRSAKRVVAFLTANDKEREADCFLRCALNLLDQRGQASGLADYLQEVRVHLVPLFK